MPVRWDFYIMYATNNIIIVVWKTKNVSIKKWTVARGCENTVN